MTANNQELESPFHLFVTKNTHISVLYLCEVFYLLCGFRDRSSILPGEGVEDIWEGVPKLCTLRGRGDENKEHFMRRTMEFLLKSWSGDHNIYINLRGGTKIPSNI